MPEFKILQDALVNLSESVRNFPVGAISLDDFKGIEEKIRDRRKSLKRLNSRILMLKAQNDYQTSKETSEEPSKDVRTTVSNLHEATAIALVNDAAIKLCLHSYTIRAILEGKEGDHDMQKQIHACMSKLYYLNDTILILEEKINDAVKEQLELKIQCQNALFDYKNYLKQQEKIRSKRLQEINPQIAKNKSRTNKFIEKINISKKLITNFIAASAHMLADNPILVEMLEKHRDSVNMETILKMSQNSAKDIEEHATENETV
ncbi:hypothetical protein ANTRET_LOCUS3894 [Anthophora retusa]